MSDAIVPIPEVGVIVRVATPADVPFIDSLQKKHSKMVGFMPTKQIEGKIGAGEVLVAWASCPPEPSDTGRMPVPLGYVIGTDRYFKHDDVGIIYQLNVAPGKQRGFVGATLLKAMFDRAAYGCRLFCCWCAQDIEANRFWEAMGFVPLAFRVGSEKKSRVHIFWQKRIRAGDAETPWWFPAKTDAGAMREDRLVLPIPPGLRWWDEMPVVRARESLVLGPSSSVQDKGRRTRDKGPAIGSKCGPQAPTPSPRAKARFGPPGAPGSTAAVVNERPAEHPAAGKPPKVKREKVKADPKLVAAARELRDRYLEHVNAGGMVLEGAGKYDVSRALPETPVKPMPLLPAA